MKRVYFPIFVDMKNKTALVIGGGQVAERRVKILAAFAAKVTVISPQASDYIKAAALQGEIRLLGRKYQDGDIADIKPFLLIAASDDRQTNRQAMLEAAQLDILASVADSREECTFYFPAIAESEDYIAGIVSKNGNHAGVRRMAEKTRELLAT
ncbi:MAG: NAD(P)-dependent oxidoreductase [Spirochaetes bacterium]|nr:NAD(P)-dependent oxidoreductase [Spirochaetota bacterium]